MTLLGPIDRSQPSMVTMLGPTLRTERPMLVDVERGIFAVIPIGDPSGHELELAMLVHCALERGLLVLCPT